jgi:hypothetical protein
MRFNQAISLFLTTVMTSTALINSKVDQAFAASPIQLPGEFAIENANNTNFVVDKFGDNHTIADRAHLYTKDNPNTYVFYGNRAANGSYEVHLKSSSNLCLTMAGGLNPNQGNGTLATFSSNCANSLNLMFMNDQTIRVSRNLNLCLTNQGNRHSTKFNKLHFWACDNSAETKWNINGNVQSVVYQPQVVTQTYTPPTVTPITKPQEVFKKAQSNQFRKPNNKYACAPCVYVGAIIFAWALEKVLDWAWVEGRKEQVWIHGYVPNYVPGTWEGSERECKRDQPKGKLIWYEVEGEGSVKTCVTPYRVIPF